MEHQLDQLDYPKIVPEALDLVNACFQIISSLQDIIVEVYAKGPSDYIRKELESYGWTIRRFEYVEESDNGRFRDYGWEDDRSSYGNYSEPDDYDVDNDSDFWRRAAD